MWAARVGFNYRLTNDNRTVLRGTYGRAYRPVFTNDFQGLHPGVSPITTARYDPATGGYTTILSVVNPIANQRLDRGVDPPFTDSFSIGVDRELFLDLSEVERIDGIVYDLVSGASVALADRGGVLVVWSREDATGAATYVIADLRGRVLEELRARLSTNGP